MDISVTLIMALSLCALPGDFDGSGTVDFKDFAILVDDWLKHGDDGTDLGDQNDAEAVMIVLTKLEVTDKDLELRWIIKNGSDHDIWLCERVDVEPEVFMAEDDQTLLIRRRLDVPTQVWWSEPPSGRYVRLSPGEERAESLSRNVPVFPYRLFTTDRLSADYATRLVLEIGFYDEDLPGLIRGIFEVAEKLDYTSPDLDDCDPSIVRRYFRGVSIARDFGGLLDFGEGDPSEEIILSYTWQLFTGEQVLRLVVDDVFIPYKGNVWLTGHEGETKDDQRQQRSNPNPEKPDRERSPDQSGPGMS